MNRRNMLASLIAAAGMKWEAQGPPSDSGSLYIPKPQLVADRKLLHDFMDEFSFVDLVTASPEIRITHIPVILDRGAGKYGTIYGHVSRQNAQSKTFSGNQSAVIVFRGPQSYISPTWYARPGLVPTWDFAVVHASGKLKALTEKALDDELAKLIQKFEGRNSGYDFAKLDPQEKSRLMSGIIGFEMEIDLLEGKFKLSQDRSEADQQGILNKLAGAKPGRSMREFMASFQSWAKEH
jgi:transcriptional regulator